MKVQAIYYHKDYDAFKEYNKGQPPYEIIANVPDDWTDKQVWEEASKPSALKTGYELRECNKIV